MLKNSKIFEEKVLNKNKKRVKIKEQKKGVTVQQRFASVKCKSKKAT